MIVYLYNQQNIFTGEYQCQLDPLESEAQGKEIYLKPSQSTELKPIPQDGKITKWDGAKWEYILDITGIYYNTATKQPIRITDLEADLTGLTKLEPSQYSEWDGTKWVENTIAKTKAEALQTLAELDKKVPRGTEDLFEKVNKMRDTVILILTKLVEQGLITNSKLIELTDSMVISDDFIDIYTTKKAERLKL